MKTYLFLFFLLTGISANSLEHLKIGCKLLNKDGGVIYDFNGSYCLFLKDGSLIRYKDSVYPELNRYGGRIERTDRYGTTVWSHERIHLHHQFKMSRDGKQIYTLTSQRKKGKICDIDDESVLVIDSMNGKIQAKWSVFAHWKKLFQYKRDRSHVVVRYQKFRHENKYLCTVSHLNSISEIPKNPISRNLPAFKEGNLIVNFQYLGFVGILDPKLQKILWQSDLNKTLLEGTTLHAVKVNSSGNIEYYLNSKFGAEQSSIESFNPIDSSIKNIFPKLQKNNFYAEITGDFQHMTDGGLVISVASPSEGGYVARFDSSENQVWKIPSTYIDPVSKKPSNFQDAFISDYSEFLSKNVNTSYQFSKSRK